MIVQFVLIFIAWFALLSLLGAAFGLGREWLLRFAFFALLGSAVAIWMVFQ
jgi:hypothetical protein